MAPGKSTVIYDHDVFALTQQGERELRAAETTLSPAEIELLVRTDGTTSVGDIKAAVRSLAPDAVSEACQKLVLGGWIRMASGGTASSPDTIDFFGAGTALAPSAKALSRARPKAQSGLTTLQRDGYYVSIARHAAPRRSGEAALTAVVVEDEPNLQTFLRHYLEFEGFEVRGAGDRAGIIAAFSTRPVPDLVLLDVMLPDADGFDVLLKIRAHPALKAVPVIMLTAKATREAVLKGLAGGANGYVTKPFDADSLGKAIRTVLGLPKDPKLELNRKDPWSKTGAK